MLLTAFLLISASLQLDVNARPTSRLNKRGNGSAETPPGTYGNNTYVVFSPDNAFASNPPKTYGIRVGGSKEGHVFTPATVNANLGDLISFSFASKAHAVVQSTFDNPCVPIDGGFQSLVYKVEEEDDSLPNQDRPRFLVPVYTTDPIYFYGDDHCSSDAMVGIINPPSKKTIKKFKAKAQGSVDSSGDSDYSDETSSNPPQVGNWITVSSASVSLSTPASLSLASTVESTASSSSVGENGEDGDKISKSLSSYYSPEATPVPSSSAWSWPSSSETKTKLSTPSSSENAEWSSSSSTKIRPPSSSSAGDHWPSSHSSSGNTEWVSSSSSTKAWPSSSSSSANDRWSSSPSSSEGSSPVSTSTSSHPIQQGALAQAAAYDWTKNFGYGETFGVAVDPNTGAEVPAWAQAFGYPNSNLQTLPDPFTGEPVAPWAQNFGYPQRYNGARRKMTKRAKGDIDTDPGVGCVDQLYFSNPAGSKVQPPPNGKLVLTTTGRGIQNYTCTNGVYATYGPFTKMYDTSCVIVQNPSLLPTLQNVIASFPLHDAADAFTAVADIYGNDLAKLALTILTDPKYFVGDFFFQFFNGTVSPLFDYTDVMGPDQFFYGKVTSFEQDPVDKVNNIPWLQISRASSTNPSLSGNLTDVILRDYTAGGVQPKNCTADQEGDFLAVHYSAHYWYFKA